MQPAQPSPGVTWSLTTGAGRRFQGEIAPHGPGRPASLACPGNLMWGCAAHDPQPPLGLPRTRPPCSLRISVS